MSLRMSRRQPEVLPGKFVTAPSNETRPATFRIASLRRSTSLGTSPCRAARTVARNSPVGPCHLSMDQHVSDNCQCRHRQLDHVKGNPVARQDDTNPWLNRLLTRRTLGLGSLGLAGLALGRQATLAQISQGATYTGDCFVEPGVALLAGFHLGQPVVPIPELLPPLDWQRYVNFETGASFTYPPDWMGGTLWAERLSGSGVPVWTAQQPLTPTLTTARIISPDGSASFENAIGRIYGVLFTLSQAATMAELGLVGETARLTPICSFEDPNPLAPSWFRATHVDGSVLVTEGYVLASPTALMPNTLVIYYGMVGRQQEFEALMRGVFLRIMYQFSSGGGDKPTPTPEL